MGHVAMMLLGGWMDGYDLGGTGEISAIPFMSFTCFAPGKDFYVSRSTDIQ